MRQCGCDRGQLGAPGHVQHGQPQEELALSALGISFMLKGHEIRLCQGAQGLPERDGTAGPAMAAGCGQVFREVASSARSDRRALRRSINSPPVTC
jgi:hypothetical protein